MRFINYSELCCFQNIPTDPIIAAGKKACEVQKNKCLKHEKPYFATFCSAIFLDFRLQLPVANTVGDL